MELRDKNKRLRQQNIRGMKRNGQQQFHPKDDINYMVPMEKVSTYTYYIVWVYYYCRDDGYMNTLFENKTTVLFASFS